MSAMSVLFLTLPTTSCPSCLIVADRALLRLGSMMGHHKHQHQQTHQYQHQHQHKHQPLAMLSSLVPHLE